MTVQQVQTLKTGQWAQLARYIAFSQCKMAAGLPARLFAGTASAIKALKINIAIWQNLNSKTKSVFCAHHQFLFPPDARLPALAQASLSRRRCELAYLRARPDEIKCIAPPAIRICSAARV